MLKYCLLRGACLHEMNVGGNVLQPRIHGGTKGPNQYWKKAGIICACLCYDRASQTCIEQSQPSNVRKVYMHEEDFTVAVLSCN